MRSDINLRERTEFINGLDRWVQAASEDEDRQIVSERIKDAYRHKSETLNLATNGPRIKSLPPEIGYLTQLRKFTLGEKELTTLPAEIGHLRQLEVLDIAGNLFTTLPPEIGHLSELRKLRVNHNRLNNLPAEIENLNHLTELNLSYNRFETLPSGICNLHQLDELNLNDNNLTTLPIEIANLTLLTSLFLNNNQFTTLPFEITNLNHLNNLHLNDNQLESLPTAIGNLIKLEALLLANNQLTTIPASIGELNNLTMLSLPNNQLSTLPSDLFRIDSGQELSIYLENNRITAPELERINEEITHSGSQIDFIYSIHEPETIDFNQIENSLAQIADELTDFLDSTSDEFKIFIQQCSRTQGWRDNPAKMFESLLNIITAMHDNDVKKGFCEALAHDVATTCGDRVALTLALMQIKIEFPDINSLADLNLSELFNASKLDAISQVLLRQAEEKISQLRHAAGGLDEIEVYLTYLEIVTEFGFNLDSIQGLYTREAITLVSANDLNQAREIINNPGIDHITAQHLYHDSELKLHPAIRDIIIEISERDEFSFDQRSEENELEYQNRLSALQTSYETAVIATILRESTRSNDLPLSNSSHSDEGESLRAESPNNTMQARSCLPCFRRNPQINPESQDNNGGNGR